MVCFLLNFMTRIFPSCLSSHYESSKNAFITNKGRPMRPYISVFAFYSSCERGGIIFLPHDVTRARLFLPFQFFIRDDLLSRMKGIIASVFLSNMSIWKHCFPFQHLSMMDKQFAGMVDHVLDNRRHWEKLDSERKGQLQNKKEI